MMKASFFANRAIYVRSTTTFVSVTQLDRGRLVGTEAAGLGPTPDAALQTGPTSSVNSAPDVRPAQQGLAARLGVWRGSGTTLGLMVASIGVLAAMTGHGVVALVAAILALAVGLAIGRTALACIPGAVVLVMVGVVVVVQLAAVGDWPNFGVAIVARLTVAGLCAASGLLIWHRRGALMSWKAAEWPEVVAMLPALFLTGLGMWMATLPVIRATNWFFIGADNVSHGLNVAGIGAMGHLDYSVWGKPGGWLSFVSLAVVSRGNASGTQDGLLALVSTNAAMLWSLYIVVSAAASLMAMALVRQYGGHRWAASMAGLAAGALMCWPQFFVFTMGAGFQTTVVQTFLLAAAASEVLSGRVGQLRAMVICSAALVLTAHNYPLALPIAGILWLASVDLFRRGRVGRFDRRDLAAITVSGCSALAMAPVLLMLLSIGGVEGVQTAASPIGYTMRLPVEWVVAGTAAGALCLVSWRRRPPAGWIGLAVVVAFMEPIGAWLLFDVSLQNYYPRKILWHVAALGVPLVAAWFTVGCLVLARRFARPLGQRSAGRLFLGVPYVVVATTVLVGVVGVLPAALGLWSKDAGRILRAATSPEAPKTQVVWRAGQNDEEDWSIQRLVAVYQVWRGPLIRATPRGLSEQCKTLRSVRAPAVLTRLSQAEVSAHFTCAPGVVRVGIQDSTVKQ
jgi:hypothetical protein